jgi:hypothetical protein
MKTTLHYLFIRLELDATAQSSVTRIRWLGYSLRFVCALVCLYLTSQVVVFGQLITFDDLPATQARVPNGYGGFSWSEFDYLQVSSYGFNPSGYQAGMISPGKVGFGFPFSSPSSVFSLAPFNFNSAYLTAAWNDNLQLEVKGYAGTTLVYDNSYILSAVTPTLIQFDYSNVNEVDFLPSGGTHHSGYPGSGEQFVIDNLVIQTPEPSILSLVLLGALCITKQIFKSQKRPDSRLW